MSLHSSEDEIIELVRKRFTRRGPLIEKGIGDDAAVIRGPGSRARWVITTDMLVEDIDFRRSWTTAAQLGHKALAENLSDLAAMGAQPRFYTAGLALPREVTHRWLTGFYGGLKGLGDRYGAALIGGDLSSSRSGVFISVTAVGTTGTHDCVYRHGGRPGDLLCVTGVLGRSAAGLRLLESGVRHSRRAAECQALEAHRSPEPRCQSGIWLARSGLVRCMMDLSDGLSVDLPRLCRASGTGATIDASALPLFQECASWGCDPLSAALHGGEDFELLFSVASCNVAVLLKQYPKHLPPLSVIGALTARPGVQMVRAPGNKAVKLLPHGFDHFRRRRHSGG